MQNLRQPRIASAQVLAACRDGPQSSRDHCAAGGIDGDWSGSWRAFLFPASAGGGRRDQPVEEVPTEIGAVLDGEDVIELGELTLDLLQTRFGGDQQQHAAGRAVVDRHANNGLKVEAATRKQTRDVGHGSGVVAHPQFKHGGFRPEWFVI
jgi:hypothetical protein